MASATLNAIKVNDHPLHAAQVRKNLEPCVIQEEGYFPTYGGSGVPLRDHPLYEDANITYCLEFDRCHGCNSENTVCIYFAYSESNVDKYGVYELECRNCRKFTAFYYAD